MSKRRGDPLAGAGRLGEVFGPAGHLAKVLSGYEYRPSQLRLALAVEETIQNGEILLAEAGTGTGKTLAYLAPAVLSGKKVVVATGTRTLQDQLYAKDLPLLASALPVRFMAALMKGRANYLCRFQLRQRLGQPLTRAEQQTLHAIQGWSGDSPRGDRAELAWLPDTEPLWGDIAASAETCLGSTCPDYEACFLTRMRQEAAAADLVIVNHHLLLADAALRDSRALQVIPPCEVLILDEAHLLEDVATDFFGEEISSFRAERLVQDAQRELVAAGQALGAPGHLGRLAEAAARFFQAIPVGEGTQRLRAESLPAMAGPGRDLVEALGLLHDLLQALPQKSEGLLGCARRAREQAAVLRSLLAPARADGAPAVRWVERRGRGVFLRSSPLDVSADFSRSVLEPAHAVVLTSATLSAAGRFDFVRARLGIAEAREFSSPSPFEYESQAILYVPRHLPDPRHPAFLEAAAREIRAILAISRGRGLVLFTSYEAMQATYGLLGETDYPLLLQGEAPRGRLLARFRDEVDSVLLATRSFWQGVDFAGETLSCLIIHKLPFGFPGEPVLEARLEYIQQQGGEPFWDYQIPSAVLTLRQGLGRLIRTGQDRGALCILDGRLLTRGYGRAFLDSLPPCPLTHDRGDLRAFFAPERTAPGHPGARALGKPSGT
ncbi:MAG: ATP-dependent DNA helicase [Candidatus Methylomirabilales bacterium]